MFTNAILQARAEIHKIVDGLKKLGHAWNNLNVVSTASQIGIRKGRRIHGLYTVSLEDLVNGVHHEDSICTVEFPIDIHSTNPQNSKGYERLGVKAKPYGIPLRSLIAKDVNNLIMVGRCISGILPLIQATG